MIRKTEGIIIRSIDYGENHKIITLLTEQGKITLMTRGAKKPNSRLSSVSQLFTYGLYVYYQSASNKMGTLSQGEIIHSYRHLRQDITRSAYAAYISELIDKLTEGDTASSGVFSLLYHAFGHIEEGKDPDIISRIVELHMLQLSGFRPHLHNCLHCHTHSDQIPFYFSAKEGGILCEQCANRDRERISISISVRKILRFLQQIPMTRIGQINVKETSNVHIRKCLWMFMDYHIPLYLKSRSFLEQLERLPSVDN